MQKGARNRHPPHHMCRVISCQRVILANSEVLPTCSDRRSGHGEAPGHPWSEEKALESEQSVRKAAGRGEMAGEFHLHWPAPSGNPQPDVEGILPDSFPLTREKWGEGSFQPPIVSDALPFVLPFLLSSAISVHGNLLFSGMFFFNVLSRDSAQCTLWSSEAL